MVRNFNPESFQLAMQPPAHTKPGEGHMKAHRFVPSHRTGCVEMMVNLSMNSRGNGGPTLNRFVLDKCHLRMNYDMWFSMFSGSLHSARSVRQVSTTIEDVFVQNNVC